MRAKPGFGLGVLVHDCECPNWNSITLWVLVYLAPMAYFEIRKLQVRIYRWLRVLHATAGSMLCSARHSGMQKSKIHSREKPRPRQNHHSRVKFGWVRSEFMSSGKNMKQALLLNPFSPNPEPAQPAQFAKRLAVRSTPVCSSCHSDDIVSHAVAQWSNESQEWQLASTFRQPAHCNGCNGPCDITWLPLN